MKFHELDTPSLLLDHDVFMKNLIFMQDYADRNHVALRPHTKTHKSPDLAKIQLKTGACGSRLPRQGKPRSWQPTV